jgi:hypothetical protein
LLLLRDMYPESDARSPKKETNHEKIKKISILLAVDVVAFSRFLDIGLQV